MWKIFRPKLAAAEIADPLHLRDFRSPVIFEFFNTIDPKQTFLGVHSLNELREELVAKAHRRKSG